MMSDGRRKDTKVDVAGPDISLSVTSREVTITTEQCDDGSSHTVITIFTPGYANE
jgi:hypothetical protein